MAATTLSNIESLTRDQCRDLARSLASDHLGRVSASERRALLMEAASLCDVTLYPTGEALASPPWSVVGAEAEAYLSAIGPEELAEIMGERIRAEDPDAPPVLSVRVAEPGSLASLGAS